MVNIYLNIQTKEIFIMKKILAMVMATVMMLAMAGCGQGTKTNDKLAIIDNNYPSEEYGVAFRKGSDVTEAVNNAMIELANEGTLETIATTYGLNDLLLVDGTNTNASQTEVTLNELDEIKESGVMKIGYTIMKPLNYTNDEGKFVGFETEFATAVCEKLGVTPEFIEIEWAAKEIELNSKNIDCIWNGMTITDERMENMSITMPYLENRQVLVVKEENVEKFTKSVDGAVVIAEGGSAGEELATTDASFAKAEYTAVASQATALMDVAAGTSDVAVIDYVMAGSSINK